MANPPPKTRRTQLDTLQDVKAEIARTVRKLRAVKCDDKDHDPLRISKAKAMVFALSALADVIERADIEVRIQKLEERTAGGEASAVQ